MNVRIASSKALLRDNPSSLALASNSRSNSASTMGPIRWLFSRSRGLPRSLNAILKTTLAVDDPTGLSRY
jgi:hypothetical protein